MTVDEFCQAYPQFAIHFDAPISTQPRVFDALQLDQLPVELTPTQPYRPGGRGRPNLNQTRTHSQCATCGRVLRNDFFYTPPTLLRRNVVYSHCRDCAQLLNAQRYDATAAAIQKRRHALWAYLAPKCAVCGFDRHPSAMDLHHIEGHDAAVTELMTAFSLSPHVAQAEALLRAANQCVPLCSNCHRMLHAGALTLPASLAAPTYRLAELMQRIADA